MFEIRMYKEALWAYKEGLITENELAEIEKILEKSVDK